MNTTEQSRTKTTRPKVVSWLADNVRLVVQISFALLCIWIGIEFHLFVKYLASGGGSGASYRPPGVDGFLPISSLMSLYHFFLTGEIQAAHPAGLFILLAVVIGSFAFGKSFCSWLCPVGLVSEMLGDLGEKLFGRRLKLPRWLDYPFRSLKYLLLGFFVYSIFFLMTAASLRAFLDSPYNQVADIKMYYFFADISRLSLIVISVLMLLSLVLRNFWCRYLCPYGALLGVLALLSPAKIRRTETTCIDCGECAGACPSFIRVDKIGTVISDECTSCLSCVDACPVESTLELAVAGSRRTISKRFAAIGIVGLFVLITGLAMVTGNWQNEVTLDEYRHHYDNYKSYGHPASTDDISKFNREVEHAPDGHGK